MARLRVELGHGRTDGDGGVVTRRGESMGGERTLDDFAEDAGGGGHFVWYDNFLLEGV